MHSVRTTTIVFAMLISGVAAAQTPPEAAPPEAPPPEAAPPAPTPPAEAMPAAPMAPPPAPPPAAAPAPEAIVPAAQPALKIETPNKSSVKIGALFQPQFQTNSDVTRSGWNNELYIRRTRILLGGTLFGVLDYFVDTDFPNLFLATSTTMTDAAGNMVTTTTKATPGMNIQDAFITYKPMGDLIKVDMGYMLPPMAHNAVQGATTLYSWDYFGFTFQHNNVFGSSASPVGRDAGFQLRGLLVGGLIEYRAGLFQGLRDVQTATDSQARNFFRFTGRLQINLLDPETGFFYAGSYLGTKRILSVGGSVDLQDSYKYFAGDVFVDMPFGPAGVLTAQVNVAHWDGGTFIAALPKQTAVMGEVGFLIGGARVSPIIRAERDFITNANDQTRLGGGLAFWPFGHNTNLKLFYTNLKTENAAKATNQINLQWQLYFF
jgi:hypothetical protein